LTYYRNDDAPGLPGGFLLPGGGFAPPILFSKNRNIRRRFTVSEEDAKIGRVAGRRCNSEIEG